MKLLLNFFVSVHEHLVLLSLVILKYTFVVLHLFHHLLIEFLLLIYLITKNIYLIAGLVNFKIRHVDCSQYVRSLLFREA